MRFKFTGPRPDELANGRPLAFGDVVELTAAERAANARLIDTERLAPLAPRRRRRPSTERTDQ